VLIIASAVEVADAIVVALVIFGLCKCQVRIEFTCAFAAKQAGSSKKHSSICLTVISVILKINFIYPVCPKSFIALHIYKHSFP
jgi:hypothetical protein